MSSPKFYRHNRTGEIFIRLETISPENNCYDGNPKLVCLNEGLFWSAHSTFGGFSDEFTELTVPVFFADNQDLVNL